MNYKRLETKVLEEMADFDSNKFYQCWMETVKDCQYFSGLLKKAKKKGFTISETILKNKVYECTVTLRCFLGTNK